MNTKCDYRANLVKLIEKLDVPDMKQILAFAAGYEAGKISRMPGSYELLKEKSIYPTKNQTT